MAEDKKFKDKIYTNNDKDEIATKCHSWGIRHLQMGCMLLCVTTLLISRGCISVAVLAMTDKNRNDTNIEIYEWDEHTQGLILSSFFWGYMVMQLPAGMLAKRFGGKPIILVALVINGVLSLLFPTLTHLGGWRAVCALRLCMGLTQAALFPGTHTLLGRWLPQHEITTYTGLVYGGVQVGTIISMPVSGMLAETRFGWKLIYYVVGGVLFATAAVWQGLAASTPDQHHMISDDERRYIEKGLNLSDQNVKIRTPWKHIFMTRGMWALVVAQIAATSVFIMFFTDMPKYFEHGLHLSMKNSAFLSALPYIGMWVGSTVSCMVCEWIYNKGILSIGTCRKIFNSLALFGIAGGMLCLSFLGPADQTLAIITLVGSMALIGCMTAGFLANHLDLSPNFAGVLIGIANGAANFGSTLAPIITSIILGDKPTDVGRWRIVFLSSATVCVVANIIYLVLGTADRQPWDDPNFLNGNKNDPEELKPVLTKEESSQAQNIKS